MRAIIREYLASLKERDELDAVMPDLLSELGYNVYSRPSRGTRQHGVDVAAEGPPIDGVRKIYLFSIKQGDLSRVDWNSDVQSLRQSLDEIQDVYIPTRLPAEFINRDIVICLCFGGQIQESVRADVAGYITRYTKDNLSFEEWNGDRIALLIEEGLLKEELLPAEVRSHFRKAVALVDEPEASYQHFAAFARTLSSETRSTNDSAKLTAARQICIALWILFVWARSVGNLESSYRASELALLLVWEICKDPLGNKPRSASVRLVFYELSELHFRIWDELFRRKILPHASSLHALSTAVQSRSPVDVSLKLFDVAGRVGMRGLWLCWNRSKSDERLLPRTDWKDPAIHDLAQSLVDIIAHNPALLKPITEAQVADLTTALMFLSAVPAAREAVQFWVEQIAFASTFSYRVHGAYPCVHSDYRELIRHPARQDDRYRAEATSGSVLYVVLAAWAAGLGLLETTQKIAEFATSDLSHCNFQIWVPHDDSERHIMRNSAPHGGTLSDVPVTSTPSEILDYIKSECEHDEHFNGLSAVRLGHWPLVVLACRHYRLPVPPHLWIELILGLPKPPQNSRRIT